MAESADTSSSGVCSRGGSLSETSATNESYTFEEEEDSASDGAIELYMYEPVASDSVSATLDEEEPGSTEHQHTALTGKYIIYTHNLATLLEL